MKCQNVLFTIAGLGLGLGIAAIIREISPAAIIALAANIIALGALIVTIAQAREIKSQGDVNRRHLILSVRPCLSISSNQTPHSADISISLKNNGLGPAFIKEYEIFVDDEIMQPHGDDRGWGAALDRLKIGCDYVTFGTFADRDPLGQNDCFMLLAINLKYKTPDGKNNLEDGGTAIMKGIDRIRICIVYESMYGETSTCVYN